MTLTLFLLVLALVFICLAAVKVGEPERLSYGWAGVAIIVLVELLGRGHVGL